jgi:polyphosphate kinase 2 (PPK2 family)
MKIKSKGFRVTEGDEVDLKKWPTRTDPVYKSEKEYRKLLGAHVSDLSAQQELLYADNRYAILLIFQAMAAAGKDGAIKHVMSGVNPQGCQVFSFRHPSADELEHDFLWRSTRDLPARGNIGIFNRSYYEEVLIVRVHRELLAGEGAPDQPHRDRDVWKNRYRSIVDLEKSSSSSSTSRRRNSASVFWRGSTIRKRTGNSASTTSRNENTGSGTWKCMASVSARRAPVTRRGMSSPPTTRKTPG